MERIHQFAVVRRHRLLAILLVLAPTVGVGAEGEIKPAAESPPPAAETLKPAAESPPPAAESPPPAAGVIEPAVEAPKPATESPPSAAAAPEAEPAVEPAKPLAELPEKRLRFTFRYQRWSDVLEWFAEQADLSLVLDAPPPGTFNYSDTRDYSVAEALDLLNSVLLTKGYTLIRRERMLTLIDVSGQFPEGLIPKVTLEEVEKRGKHELVTVEFPLGRRDPEAVTTAVTPLLGPYHKLLAVAPTKLLFVTDRAGVMNDVNNVIQSLPEPKEAAKPPVPPTPQPLELKVYPIDKADPTALMPILEHLVIGAQLVFDPNLNQLHANATAAQHALIEKALEQIRSAAATERERRIEVYRLDPSVPESGTKLIEMFKAVVPKAAVSLKEDGTTLIVWASPAEHEAIRTALDKLGGGPTGDPLTSPQLEVYRLTRVDPANLIAMLEKLVPAAKLSYDERSRSLIALAKPADQQAIRATLAQVQAEGDAQDADQPRFESYPLYGFATAAEAGALVTSLQPLVASAHFTIDSKVKNLIVWATGKEHEIVRRALERLGQGPAPQNTPQLEVHRLSKLDAATTLALLQKLAPDAQLTLDAKTGSLIALAVPADQQLIRATLQQLQPGLGGDAGPTVRFHPLVRAPSEGLLNILKEMVPTATLTSDAENKRLIAVATAADHEAIQKIVEQFESSTPPEEPRKLAVYPVTAAQKKRFEAVLPTLQTEMPGLQVLTDADPGSLTVWARPSEQIKIGELIQQLERDVPQTEQLQLVTYSCAVADPATITTFVTTLFPDAKFVVDAKSRRILVWARPQDHEKIKPALEQLGSGTPGDFELQFQSYPLSKVPPEVAVPMLQQQLPEAKLFADAKSGRVLAWASKADQAVIATAIEQLQAGADDKDKPRLVVYPRGDADPQTLVLMLASLVPTARLAVDSQTGGLAAWATPEDQDTIRKAIEEMSKEEVVAAKPATKAYALKNITAETALRVLASAVPTAKLAAGADESQLVAVAQPREQQMVQAILQEIDVEGAAAAKSAVAVYKLENKTSSTAVLYALSVFRSAFPKANFTLGADVGEFVAWASTRDHEGIQALVDRLNAPPAPENAPKVALYNLESITAASAVAVLQAAVPRATFTTDPADTQRLTASARPADHEAIKTILAEIDVEGDAGGGATVAIYKLEGPTAAASLYYTLTMFRTAFPKATFSVGTEASQFVAWATAKDHEGIKALVEQLNAAPAPEDTPKVALYTLQWITAATATTVLQAAVPKATITSDPADPQRLTALARPADHETIETVLMEIDVEDGGGGRASVAVYVLERQASPTAMSYALSLLTQAFPRARFLLGTEAGQFVAWATAKDQQEIAVLVDRLNAGPPPEDAPEATVYSLQHIPATTALNLLSTAVPKAKLSPDAEDTHRLTAYASPADQAAIKKILEKIDVEGDARGDATVAVYTLEGPTAAGSVLYTLSVFRTAFPKATFSVGAEAGQFVAWASAKDHEGIKILVEQLNAGPPPEDKPQVALYTMKFITAAGASEVLRTAVPKAAFTTDPDDPQRLTANARPADHETIKTVLAEIDVEGEGGGRSTVKIYKLQGQQADTAMTYAFRLLTAAFPRARFSLGTEPSQFVAWASAKDHQEIQDLVDRLNAAPPPEEAPKAAVYSLKNISAATAMSVLRSAVPRATLTADVADPQRLTAYATPAEQATIKEIVLQIDAESDPDASFTVSIHTLEGMSTRALYYTGVFLAQVVPKARFTPGAEEGQLVVWATAKDHAQIKTLIEQLQKEPPPELARTIKVYTLQQVTAAAAMTFLQSAVPKADVTADPADPQRINAWATPADHKTIEAVLKQLDVKPDPESAATAAVYQLEGMSQTGAFYALRFLREAVPKANIALGAEGGQLVVWARAQDHEVVKGLVKQLVEESPDAARTAQVYSLQHATAATALQALTPVVPRASLSLGADPSQFVAFARPLDHAKIAEIIKELDKPAPPETEPQAIVYTLQSGNAEEAMRVLRTAVPTASLSAGAEPQQLIAWARPADHKIIQEIVKRLAEKGPDELARKVVVYTLDGSNATAAMTFLQTAVPGAQFSVGSDPRRLIAWATPADHETIKKSVDEMEAGAAQITSQVYRFRYADPQAAYTVLQALVPSAKMAIDAKEGSLVASAMPEDHLKIKTTIDQMDREDADGQRPALKVHPVAVGSVANVYRSLGLLFRADATVQLSVDLDNDAVIAVASAGTHERIAELIKSIEDAARQDAQATLELYSLRNVDATSAQEILQQMLEKQGSKADISLDEVSDQLVAIARPEVHEQIAKLLEQLRGPEPDLEIYDLKYVDPYSAEMAILRQFGDDAQAPEVSTDPVTQQLFIRATAEQQKKIRELLIKMGETGLALLRGRSSQNMRTVPFPGDAKAALEEIRRIWPQLRDNEIRVVSPDQPLPPQTPADPPAKKPAPNKSSSRRVVPPYADQSPFQFVSFESGDSPADKPADEPASPPESSPSQTSPPGEPSTPASPPSAPAPLYVVPSDGSITIVCDDPEALEQFEKLLRAMSGTGGEIGRNISIYPLKHSNAVEIADKVRELYGTRRSSWRFGGTEVVIVPDERLNRILVQGSRIDRETIEGLIRALDTEEGTSTKPQIVPVRFAEAADIAEVVREVFRSQLTRSTAGTSSSTRSSSLSRVTPQVAVDAATNSLIVMAPSPLLDEILKLIANLDEAAEQNPARRIRIITLQKTNATRVDEALQRILKSSSPRPSRPSR